MVNFEFGIAMVNMTYLVEAPNAHPSKPTNCAFACFVINPNRRTADSDIRFACDPLSQRARSLLLFGFALIIVINAVPNVLLPSFGGSSHSFER